MNWKIKKILDEAKVLIMDIETNSLDLDSAEVRVVGIRTNKSDKVHCIWKKDFPILRKAIKNSDFVVTYNGTNFDIPVLQNDKNKLFKYDSILTGRHIDLYDIVDKRESTFGVPFLNGFSLDAVCETLGLARKQADFDYKLLQKEYEDLSYGEIQEIEKYLKQDIDITWALYEFLEEMWQPMTEFMPEYDIEKKNYLKSSMGAMTYKIICHLSGLEPQYNDDAGDSHYTGGHVFEPTVEDATGNIKCVDFASAYPHAFMQANLYTKCDTCTPGDCEYRYTGGITADGKELKLQGKYCTKNGMGEREQAIKKLYLLRVDAKKELKVLSQKDRTTEQENRFNYLKKLEQGLKIVINTIYGISGSKRFVHTYDTDTSADCTLICRFNLIYMFDKLEEFGNKGLYGDTDSTYALCPDDLTDDELQDQLDEILSNLKSLYPFPQDTFKLDIDESIKFIQFFADGFGGYKKKLYLMVLQSGEVKVKGLSVIKRDCTLLARKIWLKNIKPYIAENLKGKVPKKMIKGWINELIQEDISNASIEFKVKSTDMYKGTSSIQSRISSMYGEGKHKMLMNNRGVGVGSGVKYCTVDEAKERGFTMNDLDLARVYSNLADLTDEGQATFDRFM